MNNKLKLTSEQQKQFDLIAMYNSNFLALLKPLSDLFAPSDIPELFKIYQMDLFQLFGVCSSDDVSIQETNAIKYIICELFPFSLDNFENMDNHGMTKLFRNYEGSDYCFSEPTVPKLLNILSLYCNAGETLSHVILSDVNGSILMDYYRELLNSIGEFYLILSNNGSQELNVSQRKFIRYMKLVDEFIKQVKLPRNQKRLPPLESMGVFFPKSMEGLAISYDCIINRAEKVEIENVEVLESGSAKSINSIYGTLSVQFETDPRNNSLSYSLKVNIDNQLTHILTIKSGEQNDIHYDKNEMKITIEKANIALVFSDEDELAANLNNLYIVFNYYNAKKLVDSYITKEGIMMNDSDFDICREEYAGEYIPSSAKELNDLYSQIFESGEEPTFTGMRINNVSVKYESVDSFVTFSGDIYFGFIEQPVVAQDFFNNPFEYPFGFYKMTSDGPKQFMSSSYKDLNDMVINYYPSDAKVNLSDQIEICFYNNEDIHVFLNYCYLLFRNQDAVKLVSEYRNAKKSKCCIKQDNEHNALNMVEKNELRKEGWAFAQKLDALEIDSSKFELLAGENAGELMALFRQDITLHLIYLELIGEAASDNATEFINYISDTTVTLEQVYESFSVDEFIGSQGREVPDSFKRITELTKKVNKKTPTLDLLYYDVFFALYNEISNAFITRFGNDNMLMIQAHKDVCNLLKEHIQRELNLTLNYKDQINDLTSSNEEKSLDSNDDSLESLLDQLNSLIGLKTVKNDVNSIIKLLQVKKLREERGLKQPEMSLHLVFSGNPGTGKTTVARLLAKIYHKLGVITSGQLVEVDRSGLVGGYVGQTALKVKDVLNRALGGVLFIDEAYTLSSNRFENDYGKEAIETLLKGMEDNRNDLIVIVAGYPNLMEEFIQSNPGLKSRFNKFVYFEDYNPDELEQIFIKLCDDSGYIPTKSCLSKLSQILIQRYENRDDTFANGREVRNIFEKAVVNQANRLMLHDSIADNELMELTECDLV